MIDPLLASGAFAFELLAPFRLGLKVAAVLGAALIGGLVSGLLLTIIARFGFKRPAPKVMKRLVQLLVAVALALVVWKLPIGFGEGGFGLGGNGLGVGSESGAANDLAAPKADATEEKDQDVRPKPAPSGQDAAVLRIEMLGGERVQAERFYLVEGDNKPKTLAEIRKTLQDRQQDQPPLKGIEIIIYESSVAQNHPAVGDLQNWASQLGLSVTLLKK